MKIVCCILCVNTDISKLRLVIDIPFVKKEKRHVSYDYYYIEKGNTLNVSFFLFNLCPKKLKKNIQNLHVRVKGI